MPTTHCISVSAVALTLAGLLGHAHAQFLEPEAQAIHIASTSSGSFGWAASELGDVNGDGVPDAIIAQPQAAQARGIAKVYSGATGTRLYSIPGDTPGDQLSWAIADAGDVNLDGIPDIISGAPFGNYCRISSGDPNANPRTLLDIPSPLGGSTQFGYAVSSVGDVNGDGRSDLLIGAPFEPTGNTIATGRAYICSGLDGTVLHTLNGPRTANAGLGQGVAGVGDVDGDGIGDAAVSAPGLRRGFVFSGATGLQIGPDLVPVGGSSTFGQFFVGRVGDLTGDQVPEIYIGDYAAARATVFSGADGSVHLDIRGANGSGLGCGRGLYGDANGDGIDDLAIGAYTSSVGANGAGQVLLYSGADGTLIRSITSTVAGGQMGFDAVGLGDINGDGAPDMLGAAATGNTVYFIAGLPTECAADLNGDGILDNGDISSFVGLFLSLDLAADFNGDGILDNGDIGAFVQAFLAAC